MNETIRRAEEMRQGAIALLLEERGAIDDKLAQFGWGGVEAAPKKGKPKTCSVCSGEGHTAPTCPTKAKEPGGAA